MADLLKNSVHDTSTTSGTGTLTILGVAPTGRRTISAALSTAQTATFRIEDQTSGAWEISSGCVWTTSGSTLTRGTLLDSSTGSRIDFAAVNTKSVVLVQDASQVVTGVGFTLSGAENWAPAVTIASSATPAIGAAASNMIILTGVVTVTGFDSIAEGALRVVKHTGAHLLTYNATSLILRGAANITTEVNAVSVFRSLGSGNWEQLLYQRASELPQTAAAITAQINAAAINYAIAG